MTGEIQYEYIRVADALEAEIRSGRIPVGAALENERVLGERFGVAAGTVRRAIKELRGRGLVTTLPSKGTFVITPPATEPPP